MSPFDPSSRRSAPPRSRSIRPGRSRRAFLAASGTAVASTLAGCSVLDGPVEPPPFHDGDWLSYGNGPGNANHVAGGVPKPDDHGILIPAGWSYAPPVVHEGVVYFGTGREVIAVTPDGDERWSRRLDSEVSDLDAEVTGAPALDPNRRRLYVPTRTLRQSSSLEPARRP